MKQRPCYVNDSLIIIILFNHGQNNSLRKIQNIKIKENIQFHGPLPFVFFRHTICLRHLCTRLQTKSTSLNFLVRRSNGGQDQRNDPVRLLSFLRVLVLSPPSSGSDIVTPSQTQVRSERRVQDSPSCRYALRKRRNYSLSRCSSSPESSLLRPQHHRLHVSSHRRRET